MPAESPKLTVNTEIDLYWPPTKQWQRGVIVKDWENGEYAIRFQDDGFEDPLTYRLSAYKYRVVSTQPTQAPPIHEGEFEVESIIDKVTTPDVKYRVKWKGYDLGDCTWEPYQNLEKAKNLVDAFESLLKRRDLEDEWKDVRATSEDKAMLSYLWDQLAGFADTNPIHWTPNGTAFIVKDSAALTSLLEHTSPTFRTYDGFMDRLNILGFERQTQANLFHHPCFRQDDKSLIEFIGLNSVPLATAQQKVAAIKENEAKMLLSQQAQSQNGSQDVTMTDASNGMQSNYSSVSAAPYAPTKDFLFNTMFPPESDLDLNCCQQWREGEVSEWAALAFPAWGPDYCALFTQLGIDGRVLLECELSVIVRELALQEHQARPFEQAVKQLREVRATSLRNLPQDETMVQSMY